MILEPEWIVAALGAIPVSLITTLLTVAHQERKLRRDFQLDFAAERVARRLLMDKQWRLRSFDIIRHHLGGFDDNDLRQILVKAGAVRFLSKSEKELWGLLERNRSRLGVERIDEDPGYKFEFS